MNSKRIRFSLMLINQLILLMLISTFCLSVNAQTVSSHTKASIQEMVLAKGQPYVQPKAHSEECA